MSLFTLTVRPWQVCLVLRAGRPTRVLGPGKHLRDWRARHLWIDARERQLLLAPQEVPSADGVTLKVSAVVTWRVADAVAFTERAEDPTAAVYVAVQVGVREAVAVLDAEAVSRGGRGEVADAARVAARRAAATLGMDVLDVVVKDVVLPAELRSAYAAVVTERQRALARLEAARAETAALRALANGARLLEEHPALARIKLAEALPPGSTLELHQP